MGTESPGSLRIKLWLLRLLHFRIYILPSPGIWLCFCLSMLGQPLFLSAMHTVEGNYLDACVYRFRAEFLVCRLLRVWECPARRLGLGYQVLKRSD